MKTIFKPLAVLAVATLATGCMHKAEAPDLSGPSTNALAVTVSATPDRITQDGAAQSSVIAEVIGADGRPMAGVALRVDMRVPCVAGSAGCVNGLVLQDYGTLSTKSIVTGADGKARALYTAPPPAPAAVGGTTVPVTLSVTPLGTTGAAQTYNVVVTLMPTGTVLPPADAPVPAFTISPTPVNLNVPTTFDASTSCPVQKANNACPNTGSFITNYQWNFGDGTTANGRVVTHTYTVTGTFNGTLTVTNERGVSASAPISVNPGSADPFSGDWFISPTSPAVNTPIIFNADPVQTSPGHQIVTYNWSFGDGSADSGFIVTHTYTLSQTYNVVLSVVDDLGRKKVFNPKAISVGTGNPVPSITTSPGSPVAGGSVLFDASGTITSNGATIASYAWNFGDGGSSTSGPTVSHTYSASGSYTVRLTVTDSQGRTGTVTISVTVG